jgi:glycerophosphoryl diester phosphodiesterase
MKKMLLLLACVGWAQADPLVIAHRGASGYLPEHTLESFALAAEQGAQYLEPDLVPTRDGQLLVRHENELSETTDVSERPAFASRRCTKTIDGRQVTGWFAEDFSWAELQQLRARGRNERSRAFNGQYSLITLEQLLAAMPAWERRYGRTLGLYPETKHPSYFRKLGLPIEDRLLDSLRRNGRQSEVIIQSFEVSNLRYLRSRCDFQLAQLVDDAGAPQDWVERGRPSTYADMLTRDGLREVAQYAHIVAPYKGLLARRRKDGTWLESTGVIERAHQAGLKVHSWTFRAENNFLPPAWRRSEQSEGDLRAEVRYFFSLGLDGVFSNHPDQAVAAQE